MTSGPSRNEPTVEVPYRLFTEAGKDGYPPEWHKVIKHAVREAAGHRCVRCHHPYPPGIAKTCPRGEWTPCDEHCRHDGPLRIDGREIPDDIAGITVGMVCEAQYRILTVHHLDGDKLNCRWWNLTALCQRCHLTIQGRVRMERTWPWEHTEWFRPYVAGFYAWTYLREDLTREETLARLDELLGLERVG